MPARRAITILTLIAAGAMDGCVIQVDAADYVGICQTGTRRCKGPTVQICAPDEESWITEQVCDPHEVCRDAACVSASAPLPTPDGSVLAPDAGGDDPPRVVVVIPPLPDAGAPAQGRVVSATVRLHIAQALPGSYVDVGFCAGPTAQEVLTGPPACVGALFLRIERAGTGLYGQLYRQIPEDGTIEPKLWSADGASPEPLKLSTSELYEIRFQDTGAPTDGSERQLLFELRSMTGGTWASTVVDAREDSLGAFGLWNLDTSGTDEQALQGTATTIDLTVDGTSSWDVLEFASQSAEQGGIVQSGPQSTALDFYVTRAVAGAALLAIR